MFNVSTIISRTVARFSRRSSSDGPEADTFEDTL